MTRTRLAGLPIVIAAVLGCGDVRREPITGPGASPAPDAATIGAGGSGSRPSCQSGADCPATAPACSAATGKCGPCSSDVDCRQGTPRCDAASGGCVECLTSDDCPGVGCPGAATCPRPEATLCHPDRHRCVECVTDGHCGSASERCSALLGVCATPCQSEAVCPADEPRCDAIAGFCVGCITDADCDSAAPHCRRSECIP